ncbi:hypothetical protein U1Q18_019697 [Sarracenia purpurea var. burkii]
MLQSWLWGNSGGLWSAEYLIVVLQLKVFHLLATNLWSIKLFVELRTASTDSTSRSPPSIPYFSLSRVTVVTPCLSFTQQTIIYPPLCRRAGRRSVLCRSVLRGVDRTEPPYRRSVLRASQDIQTDSLFLPREPLPTPDPNSLPSTPDPIHSSSDPPPNIIPLATPPIPPPPSSPGHSLSSPDILPHHPAITPSSSSHSHSPPQNASPPPHTLRHSERLCRPSILLHDFRCGQASAASGTSPPGQPPSSRKVDFLL